MITFKKLTVAVAATLVWGLSAPGEQIPAGTYTNVFNGTAALYDVSGTYKQSISGISLDCTFSMDPSGKFTGTGAASIDDFTAYGVNGKIEAGFNGTVKSAQDVTRVTMGVKMKGYIAAEGTTAKFTANMKENMEVDQASGHMSGTVSGSVTVSVPGHGTQTVKIPPTPVSLDLPGNGNGSWNLTLSVTPAGNKYSGTGTAAISGGQSYPLTVTGTYSPKLGTSKLTIKGQQAMTLTLAVGFQNGQIQFESLKGKALGQRPHTP
jgi:hypothetical protein